MKRRVCQTGATGIVAVVVLVRLRIDGGAVVLLDLEDRSRPVSIRVDRALEIDDVDAGRQRQGMRIVTGDDLRGARRRVAHGRGGGEGHDLRPTLGRHGEVGGYADALGPDRGAARDAADVHG